MYKICSSPVISYANNLVFMKKVNRPPWLNWLYLFIFILSSIQLFIFWSTKLSG